MKRFESRSNLSRYVAAARSDVPDAATLERAFGPLAAPNAQDPAANGGGASQVRLLKLGGAGLAIVLATVGALFFGRAEKASNPAPVPARRVREVVPAAQMPSQPVPAVVVAPPVAVPATVPPQAAGSRRRARQLDPARTPVQPRESPASAVQSAAAPVTSLPLTAANVDAESALIESARRALHANPTRTLQLAAEHERTFGTGLLSLEREALTIHALALLGRDREARARFQELQRAHPRSIHVTRLQRVLGVVADDATAPTP